MPDDTGIGDRHAGFEKVARPLLVTVILVAVVLPFGVATGAEKSCGGAQPVLVAGSINGVPYEPKDLSRMIGELQCKGITTHSIVDYDRSLQVFTTAEGYNDYARQVGVGPLLSKEQMEKLVSEHPVQVIGEVGGDILAVSDGADPRGQ